MERLEKGVGNTIEMAEGLEQQGEGGQDGSLGEECMVQGDHACTSPHLLVVGLGGS